MAEPKSTWTSIKDLIFPHLFSDALVSGTIAWFQGKRREGTGKDAPYVHVRGQFLADLTKVGREHGNFPNIRRRMQEALAGRTLFTEDQVVKLLATIPRGEGQEIMFPSLEDMDDGEFWRNMEHLHQNLIPQWVTMIVAHLTPVAKAKLGGVVQGAYAQGKKVDDWLEQRAQTIRTQQETATPGHPVLKFFGWVLGLGILLLGVMLLIALYVGRGEPARPKPNNTSCWKQVNVLKGELAEAIDDVKRAELVQKLTKKYSECMK